MAPTDRCYRYQGSTRRAVVFRLAQSALGLALSQGTDLGWSSNAQLDDVAVLLLVLVQCQIQVAVCSSSDRWGASLSREVQLERRGGSECGRRQKRQAGELRDDWSHSECKKYNPHKTRRGVCSRNIYTKSNSTRLMERGETGPTAEGKREYLAEVVSRGLRKPCPRLQTSGAHRCLVDLGQTR